MRKFSEAAFQSNIRRSKAQIIICYFSLIFNMVSKHVQKSDLLINVV